MSALFLSVLLRMTGQLEARKGTPANQILDLMGKELLTNIHGTEQASVFYGVIDRRGFDMTFAGVGRVIGLLYSYSTQKVQRLEWTTPAFSKEFKGGIQATTISLNPRDRIILCSEGVVQALNAKGEEFGEERLYKAVLAAPRLGVHELRNEILYHVEKFTAGRDLPRDATVVVTEVKDRVIKLAKS
jgi:sigma-B regulation protein RsbU (phosphoserine phosphatase)